MTEEEAKTKWCPMRSFSDRARSNLDMQCIGSACMAWRTMPDNVVQTSQHPSGYVVQGVSSGFCGLAGKP